MELEHFKNGKAILEILDLVKYIPRKGYVLNQIEEKRGFPQPSGEKDSIGTTGTSVDKATNLGK